MENNIEDYVFLFIVYLLFSDPTRRTLNFFFKDEWNFKNSDF